MLDYIFLRMPNYESFIYKSVPKVIFSVHSPFIRDNPRILEKELKFGRGYAIDVSLKEEHLLQHPYPTDCTDYNDLWRKNNKTGARSQEVGFSILFIFVSGMNSCCKLKKCFRIFLVRYARRNAQTPSRNSVGNALHFGKT
ncbi:uncharacterized protein TNIN_316991 [Trichonephila inaurata madagascariensis]|uniref:Uncharacterized protein n=1 Tax=Trichonephila inaurata madagascariensis TaxID=2747483 RepID=A0A8X6X3H3_9ARAC|nr:uncharacterized protein TNIN_316991 [Trichonephila inaurata madagascariensis]